MKRNIKKQHGFSLVELAVVLTIIALVVGASITGMNLKRNQQVRAVMEDVYTYTQAVKKFQEKYNGLPGDYFRATTSFGSAAAGNGTGNMIINQSTERKYFWNHLQLAGFIKGGYDGVSNTPNIGVPSGPIEGSAYWVSHNSTDDVHEIWFSIFYDTNGNGNYENTAERTYAALTAEEAYNLDNKYDDGNPTTGNIRALDGSDVANQDCVITASSTYKLASGSKIVCQLRFLFD